ncbi:MAG TPA: hypothetical protein HA362_07490 [Nanoarchaeota archaeon]|nr:hypothetical protein [Nanoarchaeota archaeon]
MSNIDLSGDKRPGDDAVEGSAHHHRHNDEDMRDDSTDSRKMNIFIACLLGALVIFAAIVYINQRTGFLSTNDLAYYKYSNGADEFNVRKVIRDQYVGWQIEMFVKDYRYLLEIYNDPASLEDIPVDRAAKNTLLDDKSMFITWDPKPEHTITTAFAYDDLNKVIDNPDLFNIPVNLSQTEPYRNFTVKTCADAKRQSSVIWLKYGNETSITTAGDCVLVQGRTEKDILRAADRLSLLLLGVMN